MSLRPLVVAVAVLALLGCNREPTAADVVEANQEAWDRVTARVEKVRKTIEVLPDVRGEGISIGDRPPPLFDAPPAPPGNAITILWSDLQDLTKVGDDPMGLARRDALHQLAAYLGTGQDLDGHAQLPPDTLASWFKHVTQAQYLLVIKRGKYETPSWIGDTLIPGAFEGTAWLFDLQEGRPLGGYGLEVTSKAPEGERPSDEQMLAALHRDAILAIQAGVEAVEGARGPYSDLLR